MELFKFHLGKVPFSMTEEDFEKLAKDTEGYSAADLRLLVKEAIMEPLRVYQKATRFTKTSKGTYEPTDKSDPVGESKTLMEIEVDQIEMPKICIEYFENAL